MSTATHASDWFVWQLADSAFPTGGFAHSYGLEAAWQQGEIANVESLRRFLRGCIWQAGYGVLPLVNAVYRAPARRSELDGLAEAFLTNPVANRASRTQGRTLMATSLRVWPGPQISDLDRDVRLGHAHLAPVTGAVLQLLGVPLWVVQKLVLFLTLRGALSSAVRLGIAGSFEAQRLQYESAGDLDAVLARCAGLDERGLSQHSPLIDLVQASQDRLYSRLFQS